MRTGRKPVPAKTGLEATSSSLPPSTLQADKLNLSTVRARYDDLLIKTSEERLLADLAERPSGRQPTCDLALPQVERKGLEACKQGPPQVTERMPPARHRVVDDHNRS